MHEQELLKTIIKDINQMWVDELSRKNKGEGATSIGYSKVIAYLTRKLTDINNN